MPPELVQQISSVYPVEIPTLARSLGFSFSESLNVGIPLRPLLVECRKRFEELGLEDCLHFPSDDYEGYLLRARCVIDHLGFLMLADSSQKAFVEELVRELPKDDPLLFLLYHYFASELDPSQYDFFDAPTGSPVLHDSGAMTLLFYDAIFSIVQRLYAEFTEDHIESVFRWDEFTYSPFEELKECCLKSLHNPDPLKCLEMLLELLMDDADDKLCIRSHLYRQLIHQFQSFYFPDSDQDNGDFTDLDFV